MIPDEKTNRLVEALGIALDERDAVAREVASTEKKLSQLRARLNGLNKSASELAKLCSHEEQKRFAPRLSNELSELPESFEVLAGGSDAAGALLQTLVAAGRKASKAERIQESLESQGYQVGARYAANMLGRLYEKGVLERIGRGLYRLNGRYLAAMGVSPEDYE